LALALMNNDEGWCWINWTFNRSGGGISMAPSMAIVTPPANGQLDIVRGQAFTRIAYKPNSGFLGEDRFSLMQVEPNIEQPFGVTVVK
jgi:hypothetical protein